MHQGIDEAQPELAPVPPPSGDASSTDQAPEGAANGTEPLAVLARVTPDLYARCAVPEWFKKGGQLEELLTDGAQIDWAADNGGTIPLSKRSRNE